MANVFYLPDQLETAETIRSRMMNTIHADLDIQLVEIDPKYNEKSAAETHKRCRTYIDALRTSLVTSDPFAVVIKNELETQWCYMGLINSVLARPGYCFELKNTEMTALFPALMLMNRIVMLPEEFDGKINKHPRFFLSLTRSLDFGGLELVDYRSAFEIDLAVDRVAKQFTRELSSLIHRQKLVRRLHKPDYEELAELMKEKKAAIQNVVKMPTEIKLTARVEGCAVEGTTSPISIEVFNQGSRELHNVRVRVRGPKGALVSSVSKMADLIPPNTIRLDFELAAQVAPCCPLEIFVDLSDAPMEMPTFPIIVFVEVSRPAVP